MPPVDASTLEQYSGKQVLLHLIQEDSSVSEVEGKVEEASEAGMAFKEKGKRDVELIMPEQVYEIALAPVKPKTLSQKKLKEVEEKNVRQHLLDRHGYGRTEINKMDDETAAKEHDEIDHSDLGHKHVSDEDDDSDENDETGSDEE